MIMYKVDAFLAVKEIAFKRYVVNSSNSYVQILESLSANTGKWNVKETTSH